MKVFLKILKVLGAFLASLITPLLVAALMLAPVANTVSSVFTGDFVAKLVSNIDVKEMVNTNEELKESFEKADVDPEQIEAIVKSEAFGDVLECYTEDLTEVLAGNRDESEFNTEALKEIISDNMDEIVSAVKGNVDAVKDMTDKEIEDDILKAIDESGEEIVGMLPKAEDMQELARDIPGASNIGGTVRFIQKSLMPAVYGVIAGLALLIFLFRIHKFNGLLWDGIIFTGCSILTFVIAFGMKGIIESIEGSIGGGIADAIAPFMSTFEGIFLPFAIAYAIIGVLFIGGFIALCVLRRSKQKKLALAAAAAEAVAVEAPAAEATTEAAEAAETADEPAEEAPAPEEAAETTEEAAPEEEKAEEAEETEKTEEAEIK